ncbi:metallophosphoesterase family protein [Undibacterium sp. TJN25]|uniref:metallophosphoesterase family protein n=1 Tax=Undibacterium sp. TJN25 TaxID=3413056 RepID=UPI003BF3FF6C
MITFATLRSGRRCIQLPVAAIFALLACAAMLACPRGMAQNRDAANDAGLKAAWVELGADSQAIARAIVAADTCPAIRVDGTVQAMALRSGPSTSALRPTASAPEDSKPSAFPVASCEYKLPAKATAASIGSRRLPLPKASPQRIVILADTGCRMKRADNAWQACSDSDAWPLATIAETAAAMQPDLVLHIGDYHYRENACPPDIGGCQGSPWGYGWDVWEADLFTPAAALLAAAPWIVVRGNHEECGRAGQGWFRFLDTQDYDSKRSCDDPANDGLGNFSDPYAVALGSDTQIIVFDSSKAGRSALAATDPQFKKYQAQFLKATQLAARPGINSIFTDHHPILAFAPLAGSVLAPGNQALLSVMQTVTPTAYYPAGVTTALHGHVHDFQAISFTSDHPATFVSGNGGDNLDLNFPDPMPDHASPAPGALIDSISHTSSFGFMVMDRQSSGWAYKAYTSKGALMTTCLQKGSKISCDKTGFLLPD